MDATPDRESFVKRHRWMAPHLRRIPIGSNMPGGQWEPAGPFTVVHFGMLRPEKGLEEFIELAKLSKETGRPWCFRIVGAIVPHARDYADGLFQLAAGTGIEWHMGLSAGEVSEMLRHAHVSYLAPAGGLHERRGTLLACAANGLPIVGKLDWATPDFLKDYVVPADTPAEALRAMDLLSGNPEDLATWSQRSTELDKRFSWDTITTDYIRLFEDLLGRRRDVRCVKLPELVPRREEPRAEIIDSDLRLP
jgi:glycosyltransferase involved in cell wall biosynthesis